jgi:hypothetical protein
MTAAEAKTRAEQHLNRQDLRGHRVTYIETRKMEHRSGRWAVVFDVHNQAGQLIDGPMVVTVDDNTGETQTLG